VDKIYRKLYDKLFPKGLVLYGWGFDGDPGNAELVTGAFNRILKSVRHDGTLDLSTKQGTAMVFCDFSHIAKNYRYHMLQQNKIFNHCNSRTLLS